MTETTMASADEMDVVKGNHDASSNTTDDELFAEWKSYLQQADRPDLLLAAAEAILQLPADMLPQCLSHGFIPLLARLVHQEGAVGVNALRALLFLSSVGTGSTNQACNLALLHEAAGIPRLLEIVLSSPEKDQANWRTRVNFAMALLANMSRIEEGALDLVGRTLPEEAVYQPINNAPTKPTLELLLARFLNPKYCSEDVDYPAILLQQQEEDDAGPSSVAQSRLDTHNHDPYQHFAAILMNSTQIEAGRQFVLKIRPEQSVLQKLLGQLRSPNPLRRRGIAGMIRNICMERDSAWWLLNVVQINVHLLYPLAGPEALDLDDKHGLHVDLWIEGPDKVREPDHLTRLFLVESILLLLSTGRASRQTMRLQRTYVILKMADLVEEQEDVSCLIYDCVNYLRRDEAGTTEGSSDALIEQTYASSTTRTSSVHANGEHPEGLDFDTVD